MKITAAVLEHPMVPRSRHAGSANLQRHRLDLAQSSLSHGTIKPVLLPGA